jgi:hypothetical protein
MHTAGRIFARPGTLTALTLGALAPWAAALCAWSAIWPRAAAEEVLADHALFDTIEHPPLRYTGPDPTADHFLPSSTMLSGPVSPLLPQLAPPPPESWPPPAAIPGPTIESFANPSGGDGPVASELDPYGMYAESARTLRDHKDGFFQKLSFTATWIDRNNKIDDFGLSELDLFAMFAVPLPTRDWPLLISPTFNVRYLYGPKNVDLPQRLFETYLDLLWVPRFSERWTGIVGVAPSLYGDFQVSASEAWRLTGKGLARFDWLPGRAQILFGVLYLDRNDVRLLPAGGIIWTPSPDRRFEILFPRPKLAWRLLCTPHFEDWIYVGGEFGGNSYAVERATGVADMITLRDYRAYVGLERKLDGGAGYRLEIGYVDGRVIEFESDTPDAEADPTAMIRAGIVF